MILSVTLNSGSCVVLNKTCLYSFINDELKKSCIGKLSNNKKTRNCKNFLTTPSDHFISSPQKVGPSKLWDVRGLPLEACVNQKLNSIRFVFFQWHTLRAVQIPLQSNPYLEYSIESNPNFRPNTFYSLVKSRRVSCCLLSFEWDYSTDLSTNSFYSSQIWKLVNKPNLILFCFLLHRSDPKT